MKSAKFEQLLRSLCASGGLCAHPVLSAGSSANAWCVSVDEVKFTLSYDAETDGEDVLVEVVFGRAPDHLAGPACKALMEINGLMRWGRASTFCRDPASRLIVLRYPYRLTGSGTELHMNMLAMAEIVAGWRSHWFVAGPGRSGLDLLLSDRCNESQQP
jgi:hypothetical protein